jgi:hypothetical protein
MARNNLVIIFVVIAAILAICALTKEKKPEGYRRMEQPIPVQQQVPVQQPQPLPQPVPSMAGAAFVHARP